MKKCIGLLGSAGDCLSMKDRIQENLLKGLDSAGGFAVQKGSIEISQVGIEDSIDCSKTNCYFSNPNIAYSFGLLPLAPEEDLEKKISGEYDLPEWGTEGLNGKEGFEYGLSPSWQLRGDEVVMVFGCTPPGETTRYFAVNPYLRGVYSESESKWVEISGSTDDGKSIVRNADSNFGFENRLKTSAGQPEGLSLKQSEQEFVDSAYNKITVVLFGASASSTDAAREAAANVLKDNGIEDVVNILKIPKGFGELGLADEEYTRYAYYSIVLRYVLDGSVVDAFDKYAQKSPMDVWRLTPKTKDSDAIANRFEASTVIPKKPTGEDSDNELFLADALETLISQIEQKYTKTHAVAHSLGGQSFLDSLEIDYGKQCLEKETHICFFEMRDAAYVSVFPSILLDSDEKFTYMVGVNHRVAGTAMYSNVALNSVEGQFGIASQDDVEIYGSAEEFLLGTEFEHLQKYFYAIQFSRSCDGKDYCLSIDRTGGRSLPEEKPGILLERMYVKPQTGVGPDSSDILYPHAMTFTPWSISKKDDSIDRFSLDIRQDSPCVKSIVGLISCSSGISPVCCNAVAQFDSGNCFCLPEGQVAEMTLRVGLDSLRTLSIFCGKVPSC